MPLAGVIGRLITLSLKERDRLKQQNDQPNIKRLLTRPLHPPTTLPLNPLNLRQPPLSRPSKLRPTPLIKLQRRPGRMRISTIKPAPRSTLTRILPRLSQHRGHQHLLGHRRRLTPRRITRTRMLTRRIHMLGRAPTLMRRDHLDQTKLLQSTNVISDRPQRRLKMHRQLHRTRLALLQQRQDPDPQRMRQRLQIPRIVDIRDRLDRLLPRHTHTLPEPPTHRTAIT